MAAEIARVPRSTGPQVHRSVDLPLEPLDAAFRFAPAGRAVPDTPEALTHDQVDGAAVLVVKGGRPPRMGYPASGPGFGYNDVTE